MIARRRKVFSFAHKNSFYLVTGNRIPSHDTEELYYWIEHTLTGDGTLKNVKREKYNFTNNDYAFFSVLLSRLRRKSAGNWISKK
ncbi:hypothetical protein V1527DRAFT_477675 [Lipomyces starkeyi]